ncbi:MAG: hypothetical protein WCG97_03350 [bacterium]
MKTELRKFLLSCPLALLTLIVPALFGKNQIMTVIVLFCISLLMLSIEWSSRYIIFFILVCISGPVAESIAIYFGAWTYSSALFIGVPAWLPFVWGNAGLYISRLKSLVYSFKR